MDVFLFNFYMVHSFPFTIIGIFEENYNAYFTEYLCYWGKKRSKLYGYYLYYGNVYENNEMDMFKCEYENENIKYYIGILCKGYWI